jgi:membrane associated rhomboid family serine protease
MSLIDTTGVSPDTLREMRDLHAAETRRLRTKLRWNVGALVAASLISYSINHHPSLLDFLVGIIFVLVVASWLEWAKHSHTDPLAASSITVQARERAQALAAMHRQRLAEHPPYVTYGVIACVVIVAIQQVFVSGSSNQSVAAAGLVKPLVTAGQWWRLVSATYLHGSANHILGNVVALLILGRLVEAYAPRWRLPLAYAAAGVRGSLASWWLLPGKSSIGASGAIMGLAGFLAVVAWRRPHDVPAGVGHSAVRIILLTGVVGAIGYAFIDNAAHAGGMLTGALVAWLTVRREDAEPRPGRARVLDALGMLATVLIVAGAAGTSVALIHAGKGTFDAKGQPDVVVPIRSARASLLRGGARGAQAVIDNLSDRPIEAYTLTITSTDVGQYQQWRDDCCLNASQAREAAHIPPHDRRVITLAPFTVRGERLEADSVALALVIFADDSFEGSRNSRDEVFATRRAAAQDLDFWLTEINATLTMPVADVQSRLFARMDERATMLQRAHQSVSLFGIPVLARTAATSPQKYPAAAERERLALLSTRALLLQHVPR